MTRVYAEQDGDTIRLECRGHAGYAESGKDVVCAAISAICQTLYLWCRNAEGVAITREHMEPGRFVLEARGPCWEPWRAAVLGLISLAQGYPANLRVDTRGLDLCSKPQTRQSDKGADT